MTDPTVIQAWFKRWPDANVGVRTGAVSGIVVLDVDPAHGGDDSLAELERRYGRLPDTVESITGGGGLHILFEHPGGEIRNAVAFDGLPGLDFRGDGGYIVVPPSVHASGAPYMWETSGRPDEVELAPCPPWFLKPPSRNGKKAAEPLPLRIPEGQRNAQLASLAGSMRRRGSSEAAILAALRAENDARCVPSLSDDELQNIARSISGYAPAAHPVSLATGSRGESDPGAAPAESDPGAYERVLATFREWLHLPDPAVIETMIAAALVNLYDDEAEPLWFMYVAPPAGTKTEQLRALQGCAGVHFVSTLSATALASGQKPRDGSEPSLLRRIPNPGVLVVKDFTSVLSMNRDARAEVIAQLREIYDGTFAKEFGNGLRVDWEGKLGVLACVTPVIDNHYAIGAVLGERFLTLRLRDHERRTAAITGLGNVGREATMRAELQTAVKTCIDTVKSRTAPAVPAGLGEAIIDLAELAVLGRSPVVRNSYSDRRIDYVPDPELPTRFAKQLAGLWRGLHRLHGRDPGLDLLSRIAIDAIPEQRRRVFIALTEGDWLGTEDVGNQAGGDTGAGRIPRRSAHMILEELWELGMVERREVLNSDGPKGSQAWEWGLALRYRQVWERGTRR